MPLPIEKTTIGPARFKRRDTGQPIHAMKVQDVTLLAIRDWVPDAHTWAFSVVIPSPDGGEVAAAPGDWVWTADGHMFEVASDADFRAMVEPIR